MVCRVSRRIIIIARKMYLHYKIAHVELFCVVNQMHGVVFGPIVWLL